jgi:hypothetical protein
MSYLINVTLVFDNKIQNSSFASLLDVYAYGQNTESSNCSGGSVFFFSNCPEPPSLGPTHSAIQWVPQFFPRSKAALE